MRVLVFLLAFANLLFFAWSRGYLGTGETDGPRIGAQLRADQIRIVSKEQPPEENRADAERVDDAPPAAPPPSPAEPPSSPVEPPPPPAEPPALSVEPPMAGSPREEVCFALSDISQSEADAIERLFAEKLPAFRLSRTAMLGSPGYWVFIPPLRTRREAESKVAELRRLGVREYFIMQEGADSFAISLGLFSTRGAAESSLAALKGKGVRSVRLIERPRKSGLSQIEFLGPGSQAGEMRRILGEALPQARLGACGQTAA
ncbi:MAG: SPOR domain-containing protein [Candidatus Accumulibacter sp.]|jgi:hypothetical protein|nr:SPOR domain-containing protein [Accumulibacter sp.]